MIFSKIYRIYRVFFNFAVFFTLSLIPPFAAEAQTSPHEWSIIWGNSTGLYSRGSSENARRLWAGGNVRKIIPPASAGGNWVMLAGSGVYVSGDLTVWEQRNNGLPQSVIKIYEEGKKTFETAVQEIKAISIHPQNPEIIVCAFKNAVYLTEDGGRRWKSLGMPNYRSNGIKAVAAATLPGGDGGLTVFCSHSIYGVYYINPAKTGANWTEISSGLETLETTGNADEVSNIAAFSGSHQDGETEIYASQSFRRRLYQLDWNTKTWNLIWSGASDFGSVDAIAPGKNSLKFVVDGAVMELGAGSAVGDNTSTQNAQIRSARIRYDITSRLAAIPGNSRPDCAVIKESPGRPDSEIIQLSELWLLSEHGAEGNAASAEAAGREGLYLPVNHAMDSTSLRPYLDLMEQRNLNMVVIDMKDDYGRLRFTPQNPSIASIGRVFRPVDIDALLEEMNERGIYTVARIVVFKDPEAAARNGGRYAVWDTAAETPWKGYYDTRRRKPSGGEEYETNPALVTRVFPSDNPEYEILRTWYDEQWVDPYCEIIWDYNASIAEELYRRGFDEIQFDYIRFPTDGVNLGSAGYRWAENGMDMDSAIISFLRHVRSRVEAPISVDIYGANGWYRTGARTGQEVELLAPWVDVICPMYYPSHFEQDFLAHNPPELRPYRIYYQGTLRTRIISRGRVIVRPWAQAFYLNVSYDRIYYNTDYVRLQAEGTRAAGNGGLTYWNNSGRYEDIPFPDRQPANIEAFLPAESRPAD